MPQANLIFDMGLHKGEDTDFYLRKGFDVVAFEANPILIADCKRTFADYIADGRLRIVEGAIAPRSAGDVVKFYQNANVSVWGTIDGDWAKRNDALGSSSTIISVKRVDISEIFESVGIPFYLKIDLEGVDVHVLRALSDFADRPQYVSFEAEKVDQLALRDSLNILARLGYSKFKVVEQSALPGSSGSFQSLNGTAFHYTFLPEASGPFGEDIPQPWRSIPDVVREFNAIFRRYRLFGDNTLIQRLPYPLRRLSKIGYKFATGYRGPMPGWHDIHASL